MKVTFRKVTAGGYVHVASGVTITRCMDGWRISHNGEPLETEFYFNVARQKAREWVKARAK